MTDIKRRKADAQPKTPSQDAASKNITVQQRGWLLKCATRILQIDSELSVLEAQRLARSMLDFERTAAMEPHAAAEFVANEMGKPGSRFDRRGGGA